MFRLIIVIPTYNRYALLRNLLQQISAQALAVSDRIDLTVLVVADGCTDGTVENLQQEYPTVVIINGAGNWWWTRSVNEGCRYALAEKFPAVLLLNDDIDLHPQYLQNIYHAIEQKPGAVIGSLNLTQEAEPTIFFSGFSRIYSCLGKKEQYHPFLAEYTSLLSGLHSTVILPGRGVVIPVAVFDKIGLFDEKYLPHYKADYDFVLRAVEAGIAAYISWDAVIYSHTAQTGEGATFKKQGLMRFVKSLFHPRSRTNLRQNFVFYFRHFPKKYLPIFPITVVFIMARQFVQFLKGKKY